MHVTLINTTPDPEETIMYCARVSSNNPYSNDPRLLNYLIEHKHWSPFEMADMTVEIETSRAISPQILRHRSFVFQEFSQRYAGVYCHEDVELRLQGNSKQGSCEVVTYFNHWVKKLISHSEKLYSDLIAEGISRETARMILPLCTTTKLYMKGSVRSWIHYLQIRTASDTQKEHRLIAEGIKKIFIQQFPLTSKALKWQL